MRGILLNDHGYQCEDPDRRNQTRKNHGLRTRGLAVLCSQDHNALPVLDGRHRERHKADTNEDETEFVRSRKASTIPRVRFHNIGEFINAESEGY